MNKKNKELQPKKIKDLKVLSLFSGCGGMDLGFEGGFSILGKCVPDNMDFIERRIDRRLIQLKETRFQTIFANDILNEAYSTWVYNFYRRGYSQDIYHKESIVDLVKRHRAGHSVFPHDVDVVTGGFPCQDFSVAGKRNGLKSHKDHKGKVAQSDIVSEETRGSLYFWMKEVVDITKPKIFIAENVKGLINLSDVKDIIQRDFSTADKDGYIVLPPQVLHAANYGVPQSRERVIFIGIKKSALTKAAVEALMSKDIPDQYNPYPKPTHAYNINDKSLKDAVVLKDMFALLEEPDITDDLSQRYFSKAKFMGVHCQGQKEISLDKIGPTIRSEHHGNIEYRRLSAEKGGHLVNELSLGLKERRLTPRECALIQTFPLDYEFVIPSGNYKRKFAVSPSAAYKVIGNAVPPLLAYSIAKRIEVVWDLYFKK